MEGGNQGEQLCLKMTLIYQALEYRKKFQYKKKGQRKKIKMLILAMKMTFSEIILRMQLDQIERKVCTDQP